MKISTLRLWNIAKVGLQAIARNKMRSLLTMLGIIIGVGCVIAMLAVGTGASSSIQATINSLGTNFIMIFPGASTQSGARIFTGESTITEDDVEAIREEAPSVAYVSPSVREGAQVVAGELNWGTQVYGVDVDWPFIRAWNVAEGDFFTDVDVRTAARVAVLGATVADNLFPAGDAVGSSIRIKNVPFRVVGVLERKGGNMMGQDQDDQIIAPYTTVMKRLQGRQRIGQVLISARSAAEVAQAQIEIDALLRQRHRIGPGQEADFTHALAGGDRLDLGADVEDPVDPARLGRRDLAPRRRHRHHEHHAGLGHRAHARDRHPHGDRRQGEARPRSSSCSRRWRCRSSAACSASPWASWRRTWCRGSPSCPRT